MSRTLLIVGLLLIISCSPEQFEPSKSKLFIEVESLTQVDYTLTVLAEDKALIFKVNSLDFRGELDVKQNDKVIVFVHNNDVINSRGVLSFFVDPRYKKKAEVLDYMVLNLEIKENTIIRSY